LKKLQRKKPLDINEFFSQMGVCLTEVAELSGFKFLSDVGK